jgi:hypothetical protein
MSVLAAVVLLGTVIVLAVAASAVLGRRPPAARRRRRSYARIQRIKQIAAEDVAAVRGESTVAGASSPFGYSGGL